jgi:hypothetical protein
MPILDSDSLDTNTYRDMLSKRLKLSGGSPSEESRGFSLHSDDGETKLVCAISDAALRELVDFHRREHPASVLAKVLVSEIERLANAKYGARRFEENGELLIRLPDLILYGFRRRDKSAA